MHALCFFRSEEDDDLSVQRYDEPTFGMMYHFMFVHPRRLVAGIPMSGNHKLCTPSSSLSRLTSSYILLLSFFLLFLPPPSSVLHPLLPMLYLTFSFSPSSSFYHSPPTVRLLPRSLHSFSFLLSLSSCFDPSSSPVAFIGKLPKATFEPAARALKPIL